MKKTQSYLPVFLLIGLIYSCRKAFDVPPLKKANDGAQLTIASIKKRFNPNGVFKFSGDTNLYCVVTADETSGNLYKEVYVRDISGALHVKLIAAGGLFIGDSIRINLNAVLLDNYSGLIQLDSVDIGKSVVKLASGLLPAPETMDLSQILASTAATNTVQSRLVKIDGVEFISASQNQPYANATTKASSQYTLQDCSGNKIAIRTSGYSYFANETTPAGNGSIIAIVGQYNSTMQLVLRSSAEISMKGALCASETHSATIPDGAYLSKDFNDNSVTSGGWSVQQVAGSIGWSPSTKGGAANPYCQISNYVSGKNLGCETWLIAPPLNLSTAINPVLSFRNSYNYTGPGMVLYISNNYESGLPASATWTALPFNASAGSFVFANSGNVALGHYKSATTRFAFKYTGTASSGSTWEVDDIIVKEN